MEAHNGISAKIVEEVGFSAIWASGLSISASYGVRDCNEASWTQVVETVEFMADATTIPILLDADTGFGDYNNVRRLIQKLNKLEIQGICIEDKTFPKKNSFWKGVYQELAPIDEFCGKIKAAKDSQRSEEFCLIARTEAFVAGFGVEEALERAESYVDSGADGILVHSKESSPRQILEFMKHWKKRAPIIIVPTTYGTTPSSVFEKAGVSVVIWANHNLRASIDAMQTISKKIYQLSSIAETEKEIASLKEVFRLTNTEELKIADKLYNNPKDNE